MTFFNMYIKRDLSKLTKNLSIFTQKKFFYKGCIWKILFWIPIRDTEVKKHRVTDP
jgi:hypothetical protein